MVRGVLGIASQASRRILLVDGDPAFSDSIRFSLEAAGYQVRPAGTGKEALRLFTEFRPHLILIDAALPDIPGFEVCRKIRGSLRFSQPAIIIAAADAREGDRVAGFEVGADDFVAKPFSLGELMLRIHARLQGRSTGETTTMTPHGEEDGTDGAVQPIILGPLEIDQASHRVFLHDKEINLSVQEMRLLIYLAKEPSKMHTRQDLLTTVWGYHPQATSRTLDTHVKRLRDKFGSLATMIQTVHGVGYRLTLPLEGTRSSRHSGDTRRRR